MPRLFFIVFALLISACLRHPPASKARQKESYRQVEAASCVIEYKRNDHYRVIKPLPELKRFQGAMDHKSLHLWMRLETPPAGKAVVIFHREFDLQGRSLEELCDHLIGELEPLQFKEIAFQKSQDVRHSHGRPIVRVWQSPFES